jgi:hypothetical protein
LIAFFGQSVTAQEKVKFSVGVGTETIGTNMFLLGTKKGFFDEFGLEVPADTAARLIERLKGPPLDPLKYIDDSYLQQAIKELG